MIETLQLGGLRFEVRRSDRRKTFGLTVDRGGELVAHAPAHTSTEELSRWISKKLLWVHRRLALKEEAAPRMRAPEYVTGEAFCYLGRRYRLKIVERQERPLEFDGTRFSLRREAVPQAKALFRNLYVTTGADWLRRRVETLSARTGAKPRRVEVRDLGFRWGSCGRNRVIYFHWKLLQLPVRLVDYVIIHELIHLRENHHGPEFWRGLECALPDFQQRQAELVHRAQEFLVFGMPRPAIPSQTNLPRSSDRNPPDDDTQICASFVEVMRGIWSLRGDPRTN